MSQRYSPIGALAWYAYVHNQSGSIHVKRYFSPGDISEVKSSPFIGKVTGPFDASNKEIAKKIAVARLR